MPLLRQQQAAEILSEARNIEASLPPTINERFKDFYSDVRQKTLFFALEGGDVDKLMELFERRYESEALRDTYGPVTHIITRLENLQFSLKDQQNE